MPETQEEKKDVAVAPQIAGQLDTLSEDEKMLFKLYAGEGQGVKMAIPEIRVNYDEDNGDRGNFILVTKEPNEKGEYVKKITNLGKEITVTILRSRWKYGYFDSNKGQNGMELYGTAEQDDYNGEVRLWNNEEKKVIFQGGYKDFKAYINENFADAALAERGFTGSIIKHTEILYVEYNSVIHRMYLSKSGRDGFWEYKPKLNGVPLFAYKTKVTTKKEKAGTVTYFPLIFDRQEENDVKTYIRMRQKLDESLKAFDEVRENFRSEPDTTTVKGKDNQESIIAKYQIHFPEEFAYPVCPKCGAPMLLKDSFKGPFFGCSKFPDCDAIVSLDKAVGIERPEVVPTINLDEEVVEPKEKVTAVDNDSGQEEFIVEPDEEDVKVKDIPF